MPADACAADLAGLGLDTPPTSFDSDSLWNYEAGARTRWAGGRLTVNGANYYIDWRRPPIAADLACGFSTEVNVRNFHIPGLSSTSRRGPCRTG